MNIFMLKSLFTSVIISLGQIPSMKLAGSQAMHILKLNTN